MLSPEDKQQIQMIDQQVNLLIDKKVEDHILVETLFDFIPDIKCLVDNTPADDLQPFLKFFPGFSRLLSLVCHV